MGKMTNDECVMTKEIRMTQMVDGKDWGVVTGFRGEVVERGNLRGRHELGRRGRHVRMVALR